MGIKRPKSLRVGEQLTHFKRIYPQFDSRISAKGELVIEGDLQPTPLGPTYRFRLTYKQDDSPDVEILSPELLVRDGEVGLPHVYPQNKLCLYLPGSREWTPASRLPTRSCRGSPNGCSTTRSGLKQANG